MGLTWAILLSIAVNAAAAAPGAPTPKPAPPAGPTAPLILPKGIEVTVSDYDAQTETFALELEATPGVGPNYVTPDSLRRGIAYPGDLEAFLRQKNQMIGSIYQLKEPTPLVPEAEMKRREAKAKR